jgi:hypothetical protein
VLYRQTRQPPSANVEPERARRIVHLRAIHGQIRASSVHAHRSLAQIPVRYVSVDPATPRPTPIQGDTRRDREETARPAAFMQLAGRFRRWWQVQGSNLRRLSRRFTDRRSTCLRARCDLRRCELRPIGEPQPSHAYPEQAASDPRHCCQRCRSGLIGFFKDCVPTGSAAYSAYDQSANTFPFNERF